MEKIRIYGTPPSKSNTYKIITLKRKGKVHASLAKSPEAKAYEQKFWVQLPKHLRGKNISTEFALIITIYFPSKRNDLDNALKIVLDCLQMKTNRVIKNDNLCVYILAKKVIRKKGGMIEFSLVSPTYFEQENDMFIKSEAL